MWRADSDASETCPLCGRETSLKLIPVPSPDPEAPTPYAFVTIPQNLGPSGVGGWLWFFCFNLAVLGPALALPRLSASGFLNPAYALEQIRIVYGAVVGVFLWLHYPIALLLLRGYFMLVAAQFLFVFLRMISAALALHVPLFEVKGLTQTLTAVGIAIAWLVYFRRSERVRNTYGANI